VITVRFFAGESLARDFVQHTLAHAYGGNGGAIHLEIAGPTDEGNRPAAHYIGTLNARGLKLHAPADAAVQGGRGGLAQERDFEGGEPVKARARRDVH